MRIRGIGTLLLVLLAGAPPMAYADDGDAEATEEPLYETVVTATRTRTTRMDTTVPTDSVGASETRERGPLSVGEVVETVPGVSVNAPAGLLYTNPSIRGLGGRRVLVLRNGRRVDSGKPIGVSGYFMALQGVERIEVMRGPGSVHHGSDALGGVINVITPSPLEMAGGEGAYRLEMGTNNNSVFQGAKAGYGRETFGLRAFGQFRFAESYVDGNGALVEGTQFSDDAFGVDMAWQPAPRQELTLSTGAYLGKDVGRAVNDLDREKFRVIDFPHDNHVVTDLGWQVSPANQRIDHVSVQAYYDYVDRKLRRLLHTQGYRRVTSRMTQESNFYTTGMISTVALAMGKQNDMLIGVDGRYRQVKMDQEVQPYLPGGATPPSTSSAPFDNARQLDMGVFVADTHRFNKRVKMNGGLRLDSVFQWYPEEGETGKTSDVAGAGNLGVLLRPSNVLAVTFNVGRAFRAPTLEEKFVEFAFCKGVVCGSPDVVPEHSWNIDVGLKGVYRIFEFEAYFFNILIGDFITLVDGDTHCDYRYTNLSRAWLIGGESRLALDFAQLLGPLGMKVSVAGSYVRGQHVDTGDPLAQIPPFEMDGGLRFYGRPVPLIKNMYLETFVHYSAKQDRISPSGSVSSQAEEATGQYATLNVVGGVSLQRPEGLSVDVFARAVNLTDAYYRDHLATVAAMGRNVQLGIGVRY